MIIIKNLRHVTEHRRKKGGMRRKRHCELLLEQWKCYFILLRNFPFSSSYTCLNFSCSPWSSSSLYKHSFGYFHLYWSIPPQIVFLGRAYYATLPSRGLPDHQKIQFCNYQKKHCRRKLCEFHWKNKFKANIARYARHLLIKKSVIMSNICGKI